MTGMCAWHEMQYGEPFPDCEDCQDSAPTVPVKANGGGSA